MCEIIKLFLELIIPFASSLCETSGLGRNDTKREDVIKLCEKEYQRKAIPRFLPLNQWMAVGNKLDQCDSSRQRLDYRGFHLNSPLHIS